MHAMAPSLEHTDWPRVVHLYDRLLTVWNTPVVALNRAAAVAFADGPAAALPLLDELATDPRLAEYPYLPATRADLLRRLGDTAGAAQSYRRAMKLSERRGARLPRAAPGRGHPRCRRRARARLRTTGPSAHDDARAANHFNPSGSQLPAPSPSRGRSRPSDNGTSIRISRAANQSLPAHRRTIATHTVSPASPRAASTQPPVTSTHHAR